MDDSKDEVLEWKEKYAKLEKQFSTLKKLAHKGVSDYDDLRNKYNSNLEEYEEIKARLQDREDQLLKLQSYIEPAYDEYDDLKTKYEIEKECRNAAEDFASKISTENTKLKRESQALFSKLSEMKVNVVDISLDIDEEVNGGSLQNDELDKKVHDLEVQTSSLTHQLKSSEDRRALWEKMATDLEKQLDQEKSSHGVTRQALQERDEAMGQLEKVSAMALQEFEQLKEDYDREISLKKEAEKYAAQMYKERNVMKRQSAPFLSSAATNERMMSAMTQIETLANQLETERREHKEKLQELEEKVEASTDISVVNNLEDRVSELTDQIKTMQETQAKNLKRIGELEKEKQDIQDKLDVAEERLRPPPPPPPPPPPMNVFKNITKIIKKKKPRGDPGSVTSASNRDPKMEEALNEMFNRIKSGNIQLRSASLRRPSAEVENKRQSAMEEMHSIFSTLKKHNRSRSDGEVFKSNTESEGQLQRILQLRRKKTDENIKLDGKPMSVITESDETK